MSPFNFLDLSIHWFNYLVVIILSLWALNVRTPNIFSSDFPSYSVCWTDLIDCIDVYKCQFYVLVFFLCDFIHWSHVADLSWPDLWLIFFIIAVWF